MPGDEEPLEPECEGFLDALCLDLLTIPPGVFPNLPPEGGTAVCEETAGHHPGSSHRSADRRWTWA